MLVLVLVQAQEQAQERGLEQVVAVDLLCV